VGEILWDCFPDRKILGGAPYNLAYIASRIGAESVMVSRVGEDADGRNILAAMKEKGMDCGFIQRDPKRPTGTVQVELSADGVPSFTITEGVAYDFIEWTTPMAALAGRCDALCFGSLCQRNAVSRATILKMAENARNALRIYDINLRQHFFSKEILADGFRLAQVVKMNDGEVETIRKIFPEEFRGGERGFMKAFGIELMAVTRGPNGCSLYRGDERADVPGLKVKVCDTVGSGDAFTASMVMSCLQKKPLREIASEANLWGAYVATQPGGTPLVDLNAFAELRKKL
jgi:fructokinase